MGLDVYSGPLCRYYSGDWETENARSNRESGLQFTTVRMQPWAFERPAEALEDIEDWRTSLHHEWRPELIRGELVWDESERLPYLSHKIDWEGLHSLIFFLCCLQSPQFERPRTLPENFEDSEIYEAASRDYGESLLAALEAHAYLPSDESFLMPAEDPVGTELFFSSTGRLRSTLDWINAQAWNADRETLNAWLRAQLPAATAAMIAEDGHVKIVPPESGVRNDDRLEHAAQYAYAVLNRVLSFSEKHKVPIRYDW